MSDESRQLAGILIVVFPTVVFGGASLLWHWITRRTDYYDNPMRQRLWRAGHAHAGVLLIVSLISLLLIDQTTLADGWKSLVRVTIPLSAILLPVAFFLSILRPDAERPNRLINVAYLGAAVLSLGLLTLGIGLISSSGPAS